MITVKTGAYNKKHLKALLKAFNDAQDTIECMVECQREDCKTCPLRLPCFDIYETRMFLANKIKEVENKCH